MYLKRQKLKHFEHLSLSLWMWHVWKTPLFFYEPSPFTRQTNSYDRFNTL